MKKKIVKMFDDLCCSQCHSEFFEDSIEIVRQEDNLYVVKIVCANCHKSFGLAMLGVNPVDFKADVFNKFSDDDLKLKIDEEGEPISYDDVLDAHEYIKNLDENWYNFINEKKL